MTDLGKLTSDRPWRGLSGFRASLAMNSRATKYTQRVILCVEVRNIQTKWMRDELGMEGQQKWFVLLDRYLPFFPLLLSLLLIVLPITTLGVNTNWPQSRSNILLEMNCYYWCYWRFDWFLIWLCCFVISGHILFSLALAPLKSKDQSIRYCIVKIARRTDMYGQCWREESLARHSETAGYICVCVCVWSQIVPGDYLWHRIEYPRQDKQRGMICIACSIANETWMHVWSLNPAYGSCSWVLVLQLWIASKYSLAFQT